MDDDSIPIPSTLSMHSVTYNDGSNEVGLEFDKKLKGGERANFVYSYGNLSLESNDIVLRTFAVGLADNPLKSISFGGEIELFGNAEVLTTQSVSLSLTGWKNSWQFRVTPRYRRIGLYIPLIYRNFIDPTIFVVRNERFDVDNFSGNFRLSFLRFKNWSHSMHGSYQYYSADLSKLEHLAEFYERLSIAVFDEILNNTDRIDRFRQAIIAFEFLSRPTILTYNLISTSSSFEDYSYGYEIGYRWENLSFGADVTSSRGAISKESQQSTTLNIAYRKNDWDIMLRYGFYFADTQRDWLAQLILVMPFR